MTAFNRGMLENLASIGNGSFYHLGQQGNIEEDVIAELNKLEGKDFEESDYSNFNSYFYWFALVVLFLLFMEFVIPTVDIDQFIRNITSISFLIILSLSLNAQTSEEKQKNASRTLIRKGNSNYQNNNFEKAELNYRKALVVHPKSRTANFNLANTLYSQQKFQESIDYYEKCVDKSDDKLSRARTYHNLGNAFFKANQVTEAIRAYENALKLNPSDMDTKYNLALAKKQQKNKGGGGKNNQQQNQDKKDNKEDKKNNSSGGQPQEKPQNNKPEEKQGKGMDKEQAQHLLEALKNQEQNTQNKMEAKRPKPEAKKREKDW